MLLKIINNNNNNNNNNNVHSVRVFSLSWLHVDVLVEDESSGDVWRAPEMVELLRGVVVIDDDEDDEMTWNDSRHWIDAMEYSLKSQSRNVRDNKSVEGIHHGLHFPVVAGKTWSSLFMSCILILWRCELMPSSDNADFRLLPFAILPHFSFENRRYIFTPPELCSNETLPTLFICLAVVLRGLLMINYLCFSFTRKFSNLN